MSAELGGFVHRYEPAAAPGEPTLLLLHGTGGDENDLIPLGRAIAPRAALLSPRGRVLEHGMPRYFRRLAEGVFDMDDLKTRTDELAEFVREAAALHGFDPERVAAFGYSNGANIAASLLFRRPVTLAGAILARAMLPYAPEVRASGRRRDALLLAGRRDPLATPADVDGLEQALRAAGVGVALEWTPGDHGLHPADLEAARRWWNAWEGGAPAA